MAFTVYPSATLHMQDDLAVTYREVCHFTALCESVRLKVMPLIRACISLIKIDVELDLLCSSLCIFTCMLFADVCHVKEIQDAIWKQKASQSLIVECRSLLSHECKGNAFIAFITQTRKSTTSYRFNPRNIETVPYKGKGLKAVSAKVFGPDSCVCRSKPQADLPGEPVVKPLGVWPTDHKGVIVEMDLNGR